MNTTREAGLECKAFKVFIDDKEIVKGVDLKVRPGEVHAVMGPNGSGKSTLASALMGHPFYRSEGEILLDGEPLHEAEPDERSRRGLFLGFQYPVAVPGVTVANFIKAALEARTAAPLSVFEFRKRLQAAQALIGIPDNFASRYINDGFSGGEKKRLEILQMLLLEPKVALLDEIDSGLDIDALKVVAEGIRQGRSRGLGVVLITHYQRILDYVTPDVVHVFKGGRIARTGGPKLALELEAKGYEGLKDAAAMGGA